MAFINVNGVDIYYEIHGRGTPLILLAGYTCDHTFWQAMLNELSEKLQLIIVDNRAVGRTKDSGDFFSLEDMANDTVALSEKLGIIKPNILGQSMGGAVAQIIAKKYPDKINKLIILNSAAKINARTIKVVESLLALRQTGISIDLLIDISMTWFFSVDYLSNPANIMSFKKAVYDNPYPQTAEDQARQCRNIPKINFLHWIKDISSPTLVIAAEQDLIVLPEESHQLAKGIPNAKFVMIQGGHSSPIEQPHKLNQLIIEFLLT